MRVLGTAGHVDHGKSTLVEALTGIHPDRLKEEREREMTIDLGFAWLHLPNGEEVGIVDVPGHRDFIENMLAGVGGIDAALFVVAADEGVMPQTREHLAILDLLQIDGGVVALTKIDLVDDPEWLELVEEDVRRALAGTILERARLVRVSARNGAGIPELVTALEETLSGRLARPDLGRPRLPIDRVFTIAGFGSVVTGTLSDGRLTIGDEVEILPSSVRGRVRGLQTHKRKENTAVPGSRTAVNISGVTLNEVRRGEVVAHPGDYQPTRRLDVRFRLLPDASSPVRHNMQVKLYLGAAEVVARLRLLGQEELLPGEEGWLQLELENEVVAVRSDRYILRRPSPGETLGGGRVIDPQPKGRHKRFSTETLARLEALAQGSPSDVLLQSLLLLGAAPMREVSNHSNLEAEALSVALEEMAESGQILALEEMPAAGLTWQADVLVTTPGFWDALAGRVRDELQNYHRAFPLRRGMPKEELRSRLKISARLFNATLRRLASDGKVIETGPLILIPGHEIRFNPEQQRRIEHLLARFAASPYSPPSVKESQAEVGEDVFAALLESGRVQSVASDVVFRKEDYDRMVKEVRQLLETRGALTAADLRDHFNTSRRYILALLEYLDSVGVTIREGDVRRLKK